MRARAFSLLELVVVVVIIGVIAAIAVPRMGGFAARSKTAAASASVRQMQELIVQYEGLNGTYPATLVPNWFAGGQIPANPYESTNPRAVQVVHAGADVTEPTAKTLGGGARPYWYNRDNGEVRARVPDLGHASATVSLYNAVNGTNLTAMSETKFNLVVDETETITVDLGG